MGTIPQFPNIPEVEDRQTLGATYLNALARGCEHLLGVSHASYGLPHATAVLERYFDSYGTMATYWLYHGSDSVAYGIWVGTDSAGKRWYLHLDYYGDDDAWHTVLAGDGTEAFPHILSGTLDLSAETDLTIGKIYQWRIQGQTTDASYHTQVQVMLLSTRPTLTGWTAPPSLAAGVSDPADINVYRADLVALNAQMVAPTNALSYCEDSKDHEHTEDTWAAFTRYAYRYRPNGLTVGIHGVIIGGTWAWRVRFADSAGHEAVIYTSADVAAALDYSYQSTDLDLTAGAVAAALTAASITLTFGAGYVVTIEAKRGSDVNTLHLRRGVCLRTSNGTAGGSWADNKLWAVEDRDVGPTQLNKVRTDLLELYTGGSEELWGENHAMRWVSGSERPCAGVHQKRYLMYRCVSGETPTLQYGEDFSSDYGLTAGTGWLSFDLTSIALPLGGAYIVADVETAFESDGVYAEA